MYAGESNNEIRLVAVSDGFCWRVFNRVSAMSNDGLRIEAAASITARDMITKHLTLFGPAIRRDRVASKATVAAYIDGLAGAVALTIAGHHGSEAEVVEAAMKSLREAIARDLKHLKAG